MKFADLMQQLRAKQDPKARGLFEFPILTRSQIVEWIGRDPDSIRFHEDVAIMTYGVEEGEAVIVGRISHDNTIDGGHALVLPPRRTCN